MISGINVLNKIEITSMPDRWWLGVLVIMIIAAFAGILVAILADEELGFPLCLLIGLLISLLYVGTIPSKPTGKYTYQVTIDQTVNFKEFNDKYEVTNQEGEIYYIEEKDSE